MSRTGVVAALKAEARCLGRAQPRGDGLWQLPEGLLLAVTGMGPAAAARGALRLRQAGCDALVSFGMAGGLDPALAAGTVLLPARVWDGAGGSWECLPAWRRRVFESLERSGVRGVGRAAAPHGSGQAAMGSDASRGGSMRGDESACLLSVPAPLTTRLQKAQAFADGAIAVDMESAAVASVAAGAGLPFLAARVVTDTAHDELPGCVGEALDERGEARLLPLLGGLVRRPWEIGALLALSRRYGAALEALRVAARAGLAWDGRA